MFGFTATVVAASVVNAVKESEAFEQSIRDLPPEGQAKARKARQERYAQQAPVSPLHYDPIELRSQLGFGVAVGAVLHSHAAPDHSYSGAGGSFDGGGASGDW